MTLELDTGDPDQALCAAAGWRPPPELPAERQSHFYIDLARAHVQVGMPGQAMTCLFKARAVAAEHTRAHPHVRQIVATLLDDSRAGSPVRSYARWIDAAGSGGSAAYGQQVG